MKDLSIAILVFWFGIYQIHAQQKWTIAPQVGMALTPLKSEELQGNTFKPSLHAALSLGYDVNPTWGIRTGLTIENGFAAYNEVNEIDALGGLQGLLGGILNNANLMGEEKIAGFSSFWNIDLPLAVQYKMESGIFFCLGGYGSYLMSTSNREEITTHIPLFELLQLEQLGLGNFSGLFPENGTVSEINQNKDGLNQYGYGALGGFGYESKNWIFSCRYQYGISEIRNDDHATNINHRQSIQLTLGYRFYPDFKTSGMKPKYDLDLIK